MRDAPAELNCCFCRVYPHLNGIVNHTLNLLQRVGIYRYKEGKSVRKEEKEERVRKRGE